MLPDGLAVEGAAALSVPLATATTAGAGNGEAVEGRIEEGREGGRRRRVNVTLCVRHRDFSLLSAGRSDGSGEALSEDPADHPLVLQEP